MAIPCLFCVCTDKPNHSITDLILTCFFQSNVANADKCPLLTKESKCPVLVRGAGCPIKAKAIAAGCPLFAKDIKCSYLQKNPGCPFLQKVWDINLKLNMQIAFCAQSLEFLLCVQICSIFSVLFCDLKHLDLLTIKLTKSLIYFQPRISDLSGCPFFKKASPCPLLTKGAGCPIKAKAVAAGCPLFAKNLNCPYLKENNKGCPFFSVVSLHFCDCETVGQIY